jgi:hypothetical protein
MMLRQLRTGLLLSVFTIAGTLFALRDQGVLPLQGTGYMPQRTELIELAVMLNPEIVATQETEWERIIRTSGERLIALEHAREQSEFDAPGGLRQSEQQHLLRDNEAWHASIERATGQTAIALERALRHTEPERPHQANQPQAARAPNRQQIALNSDVASQQNAAPSSTANRRRGESQSIRSAPNTRAKASARRPVHLASTSSTGAGSWLGFSCPFSQ